MNPEHQKLIATHYKTYSDNELAKIIGKSRYTVADYRKANGLNKNGVYVKPKALTIREKKFIEQNYMTMTYAAMAKQLGRGKLVLNNYVTKVLYPKGFQKKPNRGQKIFFSTRFVPEKGVSFRNGGTFPKGNKPHNTRKAGEIYWRKKENCFYIKPNETAKPMPYSRWLWEQFNGKIPAKHNVIFADGNSKNVCLENLLLISNRDLLLRNTNKKEIIEKRGKSTSRTNAYKRFKALTNQ